MRESYGVTITNLTNSAVSGFNRIDPLLGPRPGIQQEGALFRLGQRCLGQNRIYRVVARRKRALPCKPFSVIMVVMLLTRGVSLASLAIVLLAIRPAIANATNATPDPDALRLQVNIIAGHLTHFATRAIITNRPVRANEFPLNMVAEQAQFLADLKNLSRDSDELHRLLNDPNPRVRTIALGALFVREDPHDLPYIASLIGDDAATVPDLHESTSAAPWVPPLSDLEGPQTVGRVASAMIHFYLDATHTHAVGQATREEAPAAELLPVFDRYWAERKDRAHCASWFLVKLERATRETEPIHPQYRADIDAVLAQIDALPPPDRKWTLLYALFGEVLPEREGVLSTEALLHAAQPIGSADMMKFLLLEPFSTDPDLRFTQADPRGEVLYPITAFILNHAPQLLRPGDGPVLRANAFNDPQRRQGSSLWIAASDWLLGIENPARGAAQLKADFALFPPSSSPWSQAGQMPLAVDLWRFSGASEKKFLVDWFYGLSPRQNPSLGQEFLRTVDADARPDTPELFTAIVADPRFDNANWSVLAQLLESAEGGFSTPLVPTTQIYSYQPNQFRSDEAVVFASWRNVLRRHYGLPEHQPDAAQVITGKRAGGSSIAIPGQPDRVTDNVYRVTGHALAEGDTARADYRLFAAEESKEDGKFEIGGLAPGWWAIFASDAELSLDVHDPADTADWRKHGTIVHVETGHTAHVVVTEARMPER
jgi:hypothetical protein